MKIFFSESNNDYTTYTFNYAVYCVKESVSEIPTIYDKGFLPYSSNINIQAETFYLARSLRVRLAAFEDTSENRRIDRKLETLNITFQVVPKQDFDLTAIDFQQFCMGYAAERFSNNAMNIPRFKYITGRESFNYIFCFQAEGKPVGYIFAVIEGDMFHYWYAFFDTAYLEDMPIGKWMMWRAIKWAKENGLAYTYLGTCYSNSALYKIRDFKGLEFFDGMQWNTDIKLLKEWCKADSEQMPFDRFKQETAPNEVLQNLLHQDTE